MHEANWALSKPCQGEDWRFRQQDVTQRLWQGTTDTAQWVVFIAEEVCRAGGNLVLSAEMTGPSKV